MRWVAESFLESFQKSAYGALAGEVYPFPAHKCCTAQWHGEHAVMKTSLFCRAGLAACFLPWSMGCIWGVSCAAMLLFRPPPVKLCQDFPVLWVLLWSQSFSNKPAGAQSRSRKLSRVSSYNFKPHQQPDPARSLLPLSLEHIHAVKRLLQSPLAV